jgi:hypothetical protein
MAGAGDEIRTRDLLLGKQTLYQLSYSRVVGEDSAWGGALRSRMARLPTRERQGVLWGLGRV